MGCTRLGWPAGVGEAGCSHVLARNTVDVVRTAGCRKSIGPTALGGGSISDGRVLVAQPSAGLDAAGLSRLAAEARSLLHMHELVPNWLNPGR